MHRKALRIALSIALLMVVLPSSRVGAFQVGTRWMADDNGTWISWVDYQIDPNLDALLSQGAAPIQGAAQGIAEAALQLSQPTPFALRLSGPWNVNHPNAISARNFNQQGLQLCGDNVQQNWIAIACPNENPVIGRKLGSQLFLNSAFRWNLNGVTGGQDVDVRTVALHKMAHMLGLTHDCRDPSSVLCDNLRPIRILGEDDKQGLAQLYGPMTGFETTAYQARGEINRSAYTYNAAPYPGDGSLQLGPSGVEFGVAIPEGFNYERLSGQSTSTTSYAYMTLFTFENDLRYPNSVPAYLRVQNGMKLAWLQYNQRQETISLDLEFSDGTTLRDFTYYNSQTQQIDRLRDNYCISVHPAERDVNCYGQRVSTESRWVPYEVDLSYLSGKYIKRLLIAYDNGRSRVVDNFRAYFDTVRIIPPDDTGLRAYTVGAGTVNASPPGPNYPLNQTVAFTAVPDNASWLFTGWYVDGRRVGWANPLTVTMDVRHTITANFSPINGFCDVPSNHPNYNAIRQLAARGVIAGYTNGCFGVNDTVQRSQMAAFITRGVDWNLEDWGNPFTDRCYAANGCTLPDLWRNVGTLSHYSVASGYDTATCNARGFASPCFGPFDTVTYAQTITFITRAMKTKGYWVNQGDPNAFPSVPTVHRQDVATFNFYTNSSGDGGIPGTSDWNAGATRAWFAEAEWRALNSYFKVDRTP